MTRAYSLLIFFLVLVSPAFACVEPRSGETIRDSVVLCPGVYTIDRPLHIQGHSITIRCDTTELEGPFEGSAFVISNSTAVVLQGCVLRHFRDGIFAREHSDITLEDVRVYDSFTAISIGKDSLVSGTPMTENVVNALVHVDSEQPPEHVVLPQDPLAPPKATQRFILFPPKQEEIHSLATTWGIPEHAVETASQRVHLKSKNAYLTENSTVIVLEIEAVLPTETVYLHEYIKKYPVLDDQFARARYDVLLLPLKLRVGEPAKIEYVIPKVIASIDEDPPVTVLSLEPIQAKRNVGFWIVLFVVLAGGCLGVVVWSNNNVQLFFWKKR